jgi:hypothetical protein
MNIIVALYNILEPLRPFGTLFLAFVTILILFIGSFQKYYNRAKLDAFVTDKDSSMLLIEIKNSGRSSSIKSYIRITINLKAGDLLPTYYGINSLVSSSNPETKIFEDYVVWGISGNPTHKDISPRTSDLAIVGKIIKYGNNNDGVLIASEGCFSPPRTLLNPTRDYKIKVLFGAENVKPKKKNFTIKCELNNQNKLVSCYLLKNSE